MTDASDTVIVFKERTGKPGGGKGILIGYDATFTFATEKCGHICYEEPVTETENEGGTQERRCGAFMGGQGAKARTIAYSEKISPSLKSVPSGGNTIPDVVYQVTAIQGNLVDRNVGMNGIGVSDEGVSYTLNEVDRHAVCYGIGKSKTDTAITPPPDRVFQNTGHGWWTESSVCETVRTPCGGDSMKANLIVEKIDDRN